MTEMAGVGEPFAVVNDLPARVARRPGRRRRSPRLDGLPLLRISADRVDHDGDIAISVARPAVDHFMHVVRGVCRIFVERMHNGATAALMIASADGTRTVLQLRAVSALERIAPR